MSINFEAVVKDIEAKFNLHVDVKNKARVEDEKGFLHYGKRPLSLKANDKAIDFREVGKGGIYYSNGLAQYKDKNPAFTPVIARGLNYDQGAFWQWFLTEPEFQVGVSDIVSSLQDGHWTVQYKQEIPEYLKPYADAQLDFARRFFDFDTIEMNQTLREAMYCVIGGFALFEYVWQIDGKVKLEFRFPHQVERWILNEKGKLLGVKLVDVNEVLPARKFLLITNNRYGNDFEGIAAMRTVGFLIKFKQQLLSTAGKAFYAYGIPWLFFVPKDRNVNSDATSGNQLLSTVGSANSSQRPAWKLDGPYDIISITAQGVMPDVLPLVRYLDEKIAKILKSEGSLIGFMNVGAYNAIAQKDTEHLRNARKWGTFIARHLNKVLQIALHKRFCLPVLPDVWPRYQFGLGLDETKPTVSEWNELADNKWIEKNDTTRAQVADQFGINQK